LRKLLKSKGGRKRVTTYSKKVIDEADDLGIEALRRELEHSKTPLAFKIGKLPGETE